MLTSDNLAAWIGSLGTPEWPPVTIGPHLNEMPDRAIFVTLLSGTGYVFEGAADAPGFQVRTRGDQFDQNSSEALALAIDQAILGARFPVSVNGTMLMFVTRQGGAPAPLGPPSETDHRFEYVCNYRTVVGV